MKLPIDREYMASCEGILRITAIGLGGAVFGTMANSSGYFLEGSDDDAASAHFLMWVSVFAWAITTIIFVFGLFSNPLFTGGAEYRINFIFAVLYLIAAIVYGRFNVKHGREPEILVLVYACVNWLVYMLMFLLQLCGADYFGKMANLVPKKKTTTEKKAEDKAELKEQTNAEVGISVQAVEEGEEISEEQKQPEQVEQATV